ncbi:MAG: threonylcarbamoyl-AMP synthase [Leptolinea sp.]|jgi:L-threonylcarbamoyladenylate synthase|nr:threonylcarbamoyl-AMP synthase [Leptolinea sp.]
MKTRILPINSFNAIKEALRILQSGGLVAFPTDTVYGLAANLHSAAAIDRIFQAKGRDSAKAIPVLISHLDQLDQVVSSFPSSARRLAEHFWPGALTLVVPRLPDLPANLSSESTVAIRMPDYAPVLTVLQHCGPLAVTSANLSGKANPLTAQDVLNQLDGRIDLVLDGGRVNGGVPSTIVDCHVEPPVILRQGAIAEEAIQAALQDD